MASSLRLDTRYYGDAGAPRKPLPDRGRIAMARLSDVASLSSYEHSEPDSKFLLPKRLDSRSLLSTALNARLLGAGGLGHAKPAGVGSEVLDDREPLMLHPQPGRLGPSARQAQAHAPAMPHHTSHVRDLSREVRSRLNRHGFDDAIKDSSHQAHKAQKAPAARDAMKVSVELEGKANTVAILFQTPF